MNNSVLLWGQVVTIVTFITALFIQYRLLVEKKDATIQFLEKQLQAAKEESPDVALKKLDERIKIYTAEIDRLSKDNEDNKKLIQQKNQEFAEYLMEVAEDLRKVEETFKAEALERHETINRILGKKDFEEKPPTS
jgi:hypothetical protein